MVGVSVTTIATPPGGSGDNAAAFYVSGLTARGDTVGVTTLGSMADYATLLGPRVSYGSLYDSLQTYFAEGGGRAYVARVVGASATVGNLTLTDRAGSPVSTLRVDAKSAGAWSSAATIEIANGLVTDTFTILVRVGGDLVETWSNLANPAAAVTATAASNYIKVVNLGSATTTPLNNPGVLAATALSAGTDDRGSVGATQLVAALDRFIPELGAGAVAIPGQPYSTVAAGIAAHCKATNRVGLVSAATGTAATAAATAARSTRATANSEFLGFFYPWVQVPDGAGGSRLISPEGYVAGVRARAIQATGVGAAPAGSAASSRFVNGVETSLTMSQINTLAADAVSSIRQTGSTVQLYGWRSLSTDETNYYFLNAREVLNYAAVHCEAALEPFLFRTIDARGHLFAEIDASITAVLEELRVADALYEHADDDGNPSDVGYSVDVGPAVNTPQSIARGEVHAHVNLRVSPIGEQIGLTIAKVALTADL